MRQDLTELVFLLDRSGSMQGLEEDTIGGFNGLLAKQRAEPGEAYVSTVLFDDRAEVLHDRVPARVVEPLTEHTYFVRGRTALLDALGGAIRHIADLHRCARPEDVPGHTLFVVITDGMENASCRYHLRQVREMVAHQQERHGWEFLFLGANIDAIETSATLGIAPSRASNYRHDGAGTRLSYEVLARAASAVRRGAGLDEHWKDDLEEDLHTRGK